MKSVTWKKVLPDFACPQRHRHKHAEHAAVKGHAAFPDGKYFQRMGKVVSRFVKQHLPQPAAEHHAEHAVEQQVVDVLRAHGVPGLGRSATPAQPDKGGEAGKVHQPVPAHRHRAEGNSNRIELGMNQHGFSLKRGAPR